MNNIFTTEINEEAFEGLVVRIDDGFEISDEEIADFDKFTDEELQLLY